VRGSSLYRSVIGEGRSCCHSVPGLLLSCMRFRARKAYKENKFQSLLSLSCVIAISTDDQF